MPEIPPCPFEKRFPSQLNRDDAFYMALAYNRAIDAWNEDEVPIGAVIEYGGEVIASASNRVSASHDPTAHAEILAMTQAAAAVGDWRLNGATLYVTKEPCAMCAGAIVLARIPTVVFGVADPARGGLSVFSILDHDSLNHRCDVVQDVLADECRSLLQSFFRERRKPQTTPILPSE